ncbi:hypothetical protein U370_04045 [Anaplasma marginale str. Dawn]|uniref:Uncharacterized protein n=2 Tax=Anaplasma marginale TaxID=770 RepID=B9KGT9_ANAMF|nr:hypothetical protein AM1077 [Anaplasma marginale str. St. Maries]ACM49643.1 Hypothetical protein AMF_812 [Anaplasma marginale str. Florida]AGZ79926.1 hypothetical protein U370_04045 [Anaplasma marginale str. Dawn]AXW84328.1 hypothetical protein CQZ76_04130 [Anaplasma marginale]AXW85256.1 hypothetical protein BKM88_04130 [Anaplasma marginale]
MEAYFYSIVIISNAHPRIAEYGTIATPILRVETGRKRLRSAPIAYMRMSLRAKTALRAYIHHCVFSRQVSYYT